MQSAFLGEFDDKGKRTGFTLQTYSNGSLYLGDRRDDIKKGRALFITPKGETFEGEWENDIFNGIGCNIDLDNTTYSGEWVKGKRHGVGKIIDRKKEYIGEYRKGKKNGVGLQRDRDKTRVVKGNYVDGALSGFAVIKMASQRYLFTGYTIDSKLHGLGEEINDDTVYVGQFFNSKKHGVGYIKTRERISYLGQWENGYRKGFGLENMPNRDYFEGEFLNEVKQGFGTYTMEASGSVYQGGFENNTAEGFGELRSKELHYVGEWRHGMRSGIGLQRMASGKTYFGEWRDDKRQGKGYQFDRLIQYKGEFLNDLPHGIAIVNMNGVLSVARFSQGTLVEFINEPASKYNERLASTDFMAFEDMASSRLKDVRAFLQRNKDDLLRKYFSFHFDFGTKHDELNEKLLKVIYEVSVIIKGIERIKEYLKNGMIQSKFPMKSALEKHFESQKNSNHKFTAMELGNNPFDKVEEYLILNRANKDIDELTDALNYDSLAVRQQDENLSRLSKEAASQSKQLGKQGSFHGSDKQSLHVKSFPKKENSSEALSMGSDREIKFLDPRKEELLRERPRNASEKIVNPMTLSNEYSEVRAESPVGVH
jgi:hypothetical protein